MSKKIHTVSFRVDDETFNEIKNFSENNQLDLSTAIRLVVISAMSYSLYTLVANYIIKGEKNAT